MYKKMSQTVIISILLFIIVSIGPLLFKWLGPQTTLEKILTLAFIIVPLGIVSLGSMGIYCLMLREIWRSKRK